jgi:hypothetical protein
MKYNGHIRGEFTRKALCIVFVLLIGFSFSVGGVLADGCEGGADCISCPAAAHPHISGMDVEMVNRVCDSTDQNSSCGLEAGHGTNEFERLVTSAESGGHSYSGIFSAAFDAPDHSQLYRAFLTPFQYSDRGESIPIYLRNHSLLC